MDEKGVLPLVWQYVNKNWRGKFEIKISIIWIFRAKKRSDEKYLFENLNLHHIKMQCFDHLNFRAKIVIISQKWCIIYGLMQNELSSLQQSQ